MKVNFYSIIILCILLISLFPLFFTNSNSFFLLKEKKVDHIDEGVLLQAFYWAVPDENWYSTIESRLSEIDSLGITSLWLPPISKSYGNGPDSNGLQMGYEPFDYYDIGEFDQQGSIKTRFGNKSDLESLVQQTKKFNMSLIADIILNHNRGGNPLPNGLDFTNVSSGLFLRNASHFNCGDGPSFADFPDLCTTDPYVRQELIKWGKWLQSELGFDGWRFDYVKGFNKSTVKAWMDEIGGSGIIEYWDRDTTTILNYLQDFSIDTKAFDFPLLYNLREILISNGNFDMRNLDKQGVSIYSTISNRAIPFVTNHDTVRDIHSNIPLHRDFMYAYILMQDVMPSIFWRDLYPDDECFGGLEICSEQLDIQSDKLKNNLRNLLLIRKDFAKGSGTTLFSNNDLYVYQRNGDPGLVLILNDNPRESYQVNFTSKWQNSILYDLTGKFKAVITNEYGETSMNIPPLEYAIYSFLDKPTSEVITDIQIFESEKTNGNKTTNYSNIIIILISLISCIIYSKLRH